MRLTKSQTSLSKIGRLRDSGNRNAGLEADAVEF